MSRRARIQDVVPTMGVGAAAITPSDSDAVDFAAVYVGTTGNVKVTCLDGSVAVFTACPAGFVIPVAVIKVWLTLTTASNLVGIL